jgi:CheY-like chemotaxis protein
VINAIRHRERPDVNGAVAFALLEKRQYSVQSTDSGEAGIKLAAQSVFDLVITDMGLPDVSGLETVRRIRQDRPDVKILAISGSGSSKGDALDDALRSGADAALAKPFERWIVERTFAWISRCRRLAKDFERYARTTAAFVRLAMIRLMLRRLAAMPQS